MVVFPKHRLTFADRSAPPIAPLNVWPLLLLQPIGSVTVAARCSQPMWLLNAVADVSGTLAALAASDDDNDDDDVADVTASVAVPADEAEDNDDGCGGATASANDISRASID